MRKPFFIFVFIVTAMLACRSAKLMPLTQSDVERANKRFPGTTMQYLQDGQDLFKANCAKCHPLKNPAKHTERKWKRVLPRMTRRAGVDSLEKEKITRYLITMSKFKH